jgi:hypothetical protein
MKCPKCGYVSFDYNENCPKCKKDISSDRDRMKLSAYKVDPPFLLGALIGEGGGPGVESTLSAGEGIDTPSGFDAQEEMFSPQISEEKTLEEGSEEFTIDSKEFSFEDYETEGDQSEPSEADFIHLDDLMTDEPEISLDDTPVEKDEIPPEMEPLDSILQEGVDALELPPISEQDENEALELPSIDDTGDFEALELPSIDDAGDPETPKLPSIDDQEDLGTLELEIEVEKSEKNSS